MNVRTIIPSLANLLSGLVLSSQRPCNIAAFHLGRCGSRVLGDLLKQHRNIIWDGELFSPGRLDGIASRWRLLTRDRMNILRLKMTMAGRRCYGFETQPTQVEPIDMTLTDYVQRLEHLGFDHFVLLERRNHLRRIVSILRGHQSSQWHLQNGSTQSKVRFKLDVDECSLDWGTDTEQRSLIAHLQRSEKVTDTLKQILSSRRHLFLTYEDDIISQPEIAYRRACDFAGIDYQPVNVRFKKTNPDDLSDVLTNFSEVEQTLRGTSYEWMLYS
jgi:hypothetical protein